LDEHQQLLEQARDFDEAALVSIFDALCLPMYRYIYHQVQHAETAEDLTAEVFHRFLQALRNRCGPTSHLKAWLFRVAHNLVIDEVRRSTIRSTQPLDAEVHSTGSPADETAHRAILADQARHALGNLTPKQRSVIILKFLQGMENAEVARILKMPVGAVKSIQHRALGALRRHLAHLVEWPSEETSHGTQLAPPVR
jgi:RNA polymerase sigma-70 factor, ECF subfamily